MGSLSAGRKGETRLISDKPMSAGFCETIARFSQIMRAGLWLNRIRARVTKVTQKKWEVTQKK